MQLLNYLALFGFAAVAAANPQESDGSAMTTMAEASPSSSTGDMASSMSDSPVMTCMAACTSDDVCCRAACNNVPCPDESQVNETTDCAGNCDQGSGSAADTEAYGQCISSCIDSNFLTATDGGATSPTDSAAADTTAADTAAADTASPTDSSVDSSTTGGSGSDSESSTRSRSQSASGTGSDSASSTASGDQESGSSSASSIQIGASSVGIFALLIAAMAL